MKFTVRPFTVMAACDAAPAPRSPEDCVIVVWLTESNGYVDRIRCPLPFDNHCPNSCEKCLYHRFPVFDCSSDWNRAGWSSLPHDVYFSTSLSRITSGFTRAIQVASRSML